MLTVNVVRGAEVLQVTKGGPETELQSGWQCLEIVFS